MLHEMIWNFSWVKAEKNQNLRDLFWVGESMGKVWNHDEEV